MKKYTVLFEHNKFLCGYLEKRMKLSAVDYAISISGRYDVFTFVRERDFFVNLISDAIIKFYKYNELNKIYNFDEKLEISFFAYLGAVLALESDEERESVEAKLPNDEIINLDGFYNFRLTELVDLWKNLGKLTQKLYNQCVSEDDIYSLTSYMSSVEGLSKRTIVIDGGLYYGDTNEDIIIADFVESYDKNLAINLFINRPKEIIVPRPELYDTGLIRFITALGD